MGASPVPRPKLTLTIAYILALSSPCYLTQASAGPLSFVHMAYEFDEWSKVEWNELYTSPYRARRFRIWITQI